MSRRASEDGTSTNSQAENDRDDYHFEMSATSCQDGLKAQRILPPDHLFAQGAPKPLAGPAEDNDNRDDYHFQMGL